MEPKLAPPGAGLPRIELFVARLLFRFRRATGSRRSFTDSFQQERKRIQSLLSGLSPEAAAERVLIPRLPGLEDSSRYWSVWMTLDHLRIVHRGVNLTIRSLLHGKAPPGAASTAAVKPSPDVTREVVTEFEKSCDDLLGTVATAADLKTRARYAHPWFGLLDAAGWHALSATHLALHRKQIERIILQTRAQLGSSANNLSHA